MEQWITELAPFSKEEISNNAKGFQIDLLFERRDKVITVCEIKYRTAKIDVGIVDQVEEKIQRLKTKNEIERVLIAPNGVTDRTRDSMYFDRIIEMDEICARY